MHVTLAHAEAECLRESNRGNRILRSRPDAALLGATVQKRLQTGSPSANKNPDSHRTPELMGSGSEEINRGILPSHIQLTESLNRVGMEQGAVTVSDRNEFGDPLDRPDLIIGPHDGYERRPT